MPREPAASPPMSKNPGLRPKREPPAFSDECCGPHHGQACNCLKHRQLSQRPPRVLAKALRQRAQVAFSSASDSVGMFPKTLVVEVQDHQGTWRQLGLNISNIRAEKVVTDEKRLSCPRGPQGAR